MAVGGRTRDSAQPVRGLLTWPRGPDAFPHPQRLGKGGAGGYAPSPNAFSASGGVDTPDSVLPPSRAEGDFRGPPRGSWIQILHCGGIEAKSFLPAPPARPVPLCAPPAPPMEKLRMARPARRGRSATTRCLQAPEGSVSPGGGDGVLQAPGRWRLHAAVRPPSFPGLAKPRRSQLARRHGGVPLRLGSMRHSPAG